MAFSNFTEGHGDTSGRDVNLRVGAFSSGKNHVTVAGALDGESHRIRDPTRDHLGNGARSSIVEMNVDCGVGTLSVLEQLGHGG